jgi:hypothetical protein
LMIGGITPPRIFGPSYLCASAIPTISITDIASRVALAMSTISLSKSRFRRSARNIRGFLGQRP